MSQSPLALDPVALQQFYEPIVLEKALTVASLKHGVGFDESVVPQADSLLLPEQAYHTFLNKMAHICDNRRGGTTVTAFTVVEGSTGPIYFFGSNDRKEKELAETRQFIQSILNLTGKNPERFLERALVKKILWDILYFNMPRVAVYLKGIDKNLHECIQDCVRRYGKNSPLVKQLFQLQTKTQFPRDTMTNKNAKSKFLSDCETLIKAIHANKGSEVDKAMLEYCENGAAPKSNPWHELRHCFGRLLSYRKAAETIFASSVRWPDLFRHFEVYYFPSSRRMASPLPRSGITAESIVRNMVLEHEDLAPLLEKANKLQIIGLDASIRGLLANKDFRTIVHAEVLVHNELLRYGITHPRQYWKAMKYIGTSKPTCRLCYNYFNAHSDEVQTRASHLNLYPNWRLPDIFNDKGIVTIAGQHELLETMTDFARKGAKRILQEKCPVGKNHDSNTSSAMPESLKMLSIWSNGASELVTDDDDEDD